MKRGETDNYVPFKGQNTTDGVSLSKTESTREQASRELTTSFQEIVKAEQHPKLPRSSSDRRSAGKGPRRQPGSLKGRLQMRTEAAEAAVEEMTPVGKSYLHFGLKTLWTHEHAYKHTHAAGIARHARAA